MWTSSHRRARDAPSLDGSHRVHVVVARGSVTSERRSTDGLGTRVEQASNAKGTDKRRSRDEVGTRLPRKGSEEGTESKQSRDSLGRVPIGSPRRTRSSPHPRSLRSRSW